MAATRLERIVCAMVAGAAASENESSAWPDDDAFASFVVRRAQAIERALSAVEGNDAAARLCTAPTVLDEIDPPTFAADAGMNWERRPQGTFVYFIQAASGQIKIGKAFSIEQRMQALRGSSAEPLFLVGWIHDPKARAAPLEPKLHRRFSKARVMGEWFHPVPELIEFIKAEARSGKCAT